MELRGLAALAAAVATGCLASPPGSPGSRAADDFILIRHDAGAIRSTIARAGELEETVCAPCADYVDGQPVTAEMHEQDGMIHFAATVNGKDWDLGSTSGPAELYRAYLFAFAPAFDDTAEIDVGEVSWTDCSSL